MEEVKESFSKYLHFGNLPTDIAVEEIEKYLRKIIDIHGTVRSLAVIEFGSGKNKRKKRDAGKLHCGYGYMELLLAKCPDNYIDALKQSILASTPHSWQSSSKITIEEAIKPPDVIVSKDEDQEELKKKEEKERARQLSREHKKRQVARNKQIQMDKIKEIVAKLDLPSDEDSLYTSLHQHFRSAIDWEKLHPACDPQRGGGLGSKQGSPTLRSKRKRSQAEAFAALLQPLVKQNINKKLFKVVDFGCGSGNLTLALAALFPDVEFIGLDMRQKSIDILREKVRESGLTNLEGRVGMIETFDEDFSVCLALHACGNATDFAMMKAKERSASFVVSPCCVGKLKFSLTGGNSYGHQWNDFTKEGAEGLEPDKVLDHPRSVWMRKLVTMEDFKLLAQAADCHEDSGQVEKTSKTLVELDRSRCMEEAGYSTALIRLTQEVSYPKNDAIVGVWGNETNIKHILSFKE